MAFRSHMVRPFDPRLTSNRLMFGLVGVVSVASVVVWATGKPIESLWAGPLAFLIWAVVREIDPDHNWTALLAAALAGGWLLLGYPGPPISAGIGLVVAARLVLNSTGRRPLISDLMVLGVVATAISYTRPGWVAGFGMALAIYIDDRMSETPGQRAVLTAGLAALGSTIVATAARAFPSQVPHINPVAVSVAGLLALLSLLRPPPDPVSLVDSRLKTPLSPQRLHASRSLTSVLAFATTVLVGVEVEQMVPVLLALGLSVVSAEIERVRRRG